MLPDADRPEPNDLAGALVSNLSEGSSLPLALGLDKFSELPLLLELLANACACVP